MELEVYKKSDFYEDYISSQKEYYERENADAYFAERLSEKDAEIVKLKAANKQLNAKLKESEEARYEAGADAADYYQDNRKLKRTLWLARANRALEKIAWFKLWNASISTMNPEDGARQEYDKWKRNLGKFLKNAEEYK